MKKDILFLCQFFYPEYISSATLPYDTVTALTEAGLQTDVLCGYPVEYYKGAPVPEKETLNSGVFIRRLKYLQLSRKGVLGRLINYFSFTFQMFLHMSVFRKYKALVVYSNPPILPWVAALGKRLFGCKLVFVAYDLYPEIAVRTHVLREGSIICRLMNHINKAVFRRADGVVALSGEMKQFIVQNRDISADKVHVIPNWFADGKQKETGRQNAFTQMKGNRFTVSYFGNMGTMQDMHTILGAIRQLKDNPDILFFFAGHGNKMQTLKETIAKERLSNAVVLDFLHGQDYLDALQISDAALVTLEKNTVGLCVPSKTYGYMMQGIPLIAVMDPCDIVSDIQSGAGVWVANGGSDELAKAILDMHTDRKALAAMGQTSRRLYEEKYTTKICTQQYVELFQKLL